LEDMSTTDFSQVTKSLDEVVTTGVSFRSALSFLGQDQADPSDYDFFIFGESMKAAVRLLTDKSIFSTYRLYCEDEAVVTIIIRPVDNLSPNSIQAPSAPQSLRERRRISGKHKLQNVVIRQGSHRETDLFDTDTLLPMNG